MTHAAMLLSALLAATPFGPFTGTAAKGSPPAPVPPTVSFYGDSLAFGLGSTTPPPLALQGILPPGYVVVNRGATGETAHQIASRSISGWATACLGEPCKVYVLQGGVNTLKHPDFNAASTAAVAAAALTGNGGACASGVSHSCGMLDAADALHLSRPSAQIVIVGVLPFGVCGICSAAPDPGPRARAYNAALLEACASRPWLRCASPYAVFEDAQTPNALSSTYGSGDGIHLKNAGSAELAARVLAAGVW